MVGRMQDWVKGGSAYMKNLNISNGMEYRQTHNYIFSILHYKKISLEFKGWVVPPKLPSPWSSMARFGSVEMGYGFYI